MNATIRTGFIAAVVLLGQALAAQQTYPVFGLGTERTCGDLIRAKEQRTPNDSAAYAAMLSWMQGFVTGGALERSTGDFIWDGLVLAGTRDDTVRNDLRTTRAAYCRDNAKDPICSIWTKTPVRALREGSVLRKTNSNGLIGWTERYCAEHPLEQFESAVHKLLLELWAEPQSSNEKNR